MAKMCWKCNEYHEDGLEKCPFCGAMFTAENASYRNDGRTVSDVDEDAYLRAPPPAYRRSYHMVLPAVLVILISAVIVYAVVDFSRILEPDVYYDYSIIFTDTGDGSVLAVCDVMMIDNKVSLIDWSGVVFELSVQGNTYMPSSADMTDYGLLCRWSVVFEIPGAQSLDGYTIEITHPEGYSFGHNGSLL